MIKHTFPTIKIESSDDAIKRGVKIQTDFSTVSEKKKFKKELAEKEIKYNAANDTHGADEYRQLQIIKKMQR